MRSLVQLRNQQDGQILIEFKEGIQTLIFDLFSSEESLGLESFEIGDTLEITEGITVQNVIFNRFV